jgi:hypothetical protein
MATCSRCGNHWQTLPGEEVDHGCSRCGFDGEEEPEDYRPPVQPFEMALGCDIPSIREEADRYVSDPEELALVRGLLDSLRITLCRLQKEVVA